MSLWHIVKNKMARAEIFQEHGWRNIQVTQLIGVHNVSLAKLITLHIATGALKVLILSHISQKIFNILCYNCNTSNLNHTEGENPQKDGLHI